MVLEDYLRLKKLFAQRMMQKAASCQSSISEVARRVEGEGKLRVVPQPWGCRVSFTLLKQGLSFSLGLFPEHGVWGAGFGCLLVFFVLRKVGKEWEVEDGARVGKALTRPCSSGQLPEGASGGAEQ